MRHEFKALIFDVVAAGQSVNVAAFLRIVECCHMHPGLLAFASGGLLYIVSAAANAMQPAGNTTVPAWLAVAAVAACHAMVGFFVIGDHKPGSALLRVVASTLTTSLALATALAVVVLFPLPLSPDVALTLVMLSIIGSVVALTVTATLAWRGSKR